jgi:hypothetical protein
MEGRESEREGEASLNVNLVTKCGKKFGVRRNAPGRRFPRRVAR